ncbi:MAG: hypothetical protein R6X19_01985 [Kiritimatiellia bacterium]
MKTMLLAFMGLLLVSGSAWAADGDGSTVDLVVFGNYYEPDNNVYDESWGAEVQLRFWMDEVFGLAIAGGYAEWNLNDDIGEDTDIGDLFDFERDGDVALIPVGASLLFRPVHTERLCLVLEGGVRYVFVDDDVDQDALTPGLAVIRNKVDIDDGLVAIAMAQLQLNLTDAIFLIAGAGYQWDIEKGDVDVGGVKVAENELESFVAQAGLGIRF